jgi:hypothetical protein
LTGRKYVIRKFGKVVIFIASCALTCVLVFAAWSPTAQAQGGNINTITDRSGSIANGGQSQQAVPQNLLRKRLIVENPCTTGSQGIGSTESLFFTFTAAAQTGGSSLELAACGIWDSGSGPVSSEPVNVTAATTNHKFVIKEE